MERKLPKEIEEALGDQNNFRKICKIVNNFGISPSGMGMRKLDEIFEKVFSGLLPPNQVAQEIKRTFGFSDELSQDIANEMEKEIFSNYKSGLESLYFQEMNSFMPKSAQKIEKKISEENLQVKETPKEASFLEPEEVASPKKEIQSQDNLKTEKKDEVNSLLEDLLKEIDETKKRIKE